MCASSYELTYMNYISLTELARARRLDIRAYSDWLFKDD